MRVGNEERLRKLKYDSGKSTLREVKDEFNALVKAGKHPKLKVKKKSILIEYRR